MYSLKIGRRIFKVDESDLVLDNGVCQILLTKKVWKDFSEYSPTIPKKTFKKLLREGVLVLTSEKYIGWNGEVRDGMPIYRFNPGAASEN